MSQEKSKTMPMQIVLGKKRCIMGFVQVENEFFKITAGILARSLANFYCQ